MTHLNWYDLDDWLSVKFKKSICRSGFHWPSQSVIYSFQELIIFGLLNKHQKRSHCQLSEIRFLSTRKVKILDRLRIGKEQCCDKSFCIFKATKDSCYIHTRARARNNNTWKNYLWHYAPVFLFRRGLWKASVRRQSNRKKSRQEYGMKGEKLIKNNSMMCS